MFVRLIFTLFFELVVLLYQNIVGMEAVFYSVGDQNVTVFNQMY